jgi:hypothetical protein
MYSKTIDGDGLMGNMLLLLMMMMIMQGTGTHSKALTLTEMGVRVSSPCEASYTAPVTLPARSPSSRTYQSPSTKYTALICVSITSVNTWSSANLVKRHNNRSGNK